MNFADLLIDPGEWLASEGNYNPIVISSRIRFARNLRERAFPGWAKKAERLDILNAIKPSVLALSEMQDAFAADMHELNPLDKNVLVERHLISREQQSKGAGSGVIINPDATLSIMINEEDHLRMQAIRPGFQLDNAFAMLNTVDDELEDRLDFAFDSELGFLTACPTNVGTGMRASAMMHLPGLVLADQMNQVIQGVNKIGLVVRGIHGEGTEALGNLFQVSNQITLGQSEEQILNMLDEVIRKMLDHEQNARETLIESKASMLKDQIGRAYGILRYAHSINSKEALNLLSLIKLGADLCVFPESQRLAIDALFTLTQPAHLQRGSDQKLPAEERDRLRAELIRQRLKSLPSPDNDIQPGNESSAQRGRNDE